MRFHWESAERQTAVIGMFLELFEDRIGFGVVPRTARDQVNPPAVYAESDGNDHLREQTCRLCGRINVNVPSWFRTLTILVIPV